MPSIAVFGSTGAVGGQVLRAAATLPAYDRVHEVGRRSAETTDGKVSFQAVDFEAIDKDEALRKLGPDVVISALGTTRAQAGSAANFRKIDHDYVVSGARALLDSSKQQRLIYCSVRRRCARAADAAVARRIGLQPVPVSQQQGQDRGRLVVARLQRGASP